MEQQHSSPPPPTISWSAVALFVYSPRAAGLDETQEEDEQLLFYHPEIVTAEEKKGQVGLVAGLVAFANLFSNEQNSVRVINSQHHLLVVQQVEPDVWIVMCYRQPHVQTSTHTKWLDMSTDIDTHQQSLVKVVDNLFTTFKLLHGSITNLLFHPSSPPSADRWCISSSSRLALEDILSDFVPAYLRAIYSTHPLSIFNELNGFHFGPVERSVYLSVHSFLCILHRKFGDIRYAAVLFDTHLLYSGLAHEDMKQLYAYLVCYNGTLSARKLNQPPFGRTPTAAAMPGGGASSFGRANTFRDPDGFLLGPCQSASGGSTSVFVPVVNLSDGSSGYLVVLLFHRLMLIMIMNKTNAEPLDSEMLNELREKCVKMPGGLNDLHDLIGEQFDRIMGDEDAYRFVYYNSANNAIRLSNRGKSTGALVGLSGEEVEIVGAMHEVLNSSENDVHRISHKPSASRGWVAAAKSLDGEFYLLLEGPNTTLSKTKEECARFSHIHFANIFVS
eukprot:GHVS01105211.1.p1 GENE.GHVS01105211.1~~GHVS01105211.1.p1  ORF type:complete len:502 (+),score=70.43 GHVS01105211.1:59-1564(+)